MPQKIQPLTRQLLADSPIASGEDPDFLTLEAGDAYHQIAYMLSANGEFFATGSNIRQPSGRLNRGRRGEVVFWQTMPSERK